MEQKLNLAVSQGTRKLLVDLDGTEYISSAGLKVLLETEKKLKREKGQIRLCSLQPRVKEVLDAAEFNQIFKTYNSVQEGINSF